RASLPSGRPDEQSKTSEKTLDSRFRGNDDGGWQQRRCLPVTIRTMTQDKYTMFRNRLQKVLAHRRKVAKKQAVSCYRLYDLDLPEFPLAIDLYEDHVHVSEYRRNHTLGEA